MEYQKIEFNESELKSFQDFFPNGAGANIMQRIMFKVAAQYEESLRSQLSGLDTVRASQGGLKAIEEITQLLIGFTKVEILTEGEVADKLYDEEEEQRDGTETRVDY